MTLLARDIMQTEVITVPPDMPLSEAANLFFRKRIGGAPVVQGRGDGASLVLGIISRSDLMRFPLYQGAVAGMLGEYLRNLAAADGEIDAPPPPSPLCDDLAAHTVREAMAADPITVAPATPLREVAQTMLSQHMHRLLVEENGELHGLISSLDLVRLIADGRLS
jgi:CBS domain-containing protein